MTELKVFKFYSKHANFRHRFKCGTVVKFTPMSKSKGAPGVMTTNDKEIADLITNSHMYGDKKTHYFFNKPLWNAIKDQYQTKVNDDEVKEYQEKLNKEKDEKALLLQQQSDMKTDFVEFSKLQARIANRNGTFSADATEEEKTRYNELKEKIGL